MPASTDRVDPGGDTPRTGPGDIYIDAARELSRESIVPTQEALDADREADRVADGDPDVVLAPDDRGARADAAIDEADRADDDAVL